MTGQAPRDGLFYPDTIPHHERHPSESAFEIVETSDSRGRGMVARAPFSPDEVMAQLSGVLVPDPSLNTIQFGPGLHMSDPWFCRFILHSCDPNARIDTATARLIARRAIAPGDFLSVDYGATEDRLGRQFECRCGATNCRGWMMGRKEEPTEEGKRVLAKRGDRSTAGP